jgi:hypothetical protein
MPAGVAFEALGGLNFRERQSLGGHIGCLARCALHTGHSSTTLRVAFRGVWDCALTWGNSPQLSVFVT